MQSVAIHRRGGAPRGNKNASKRPDDATLLHYKRRLLSRDLTREQMAQELGVSMSTTFAWVPALGVYPAVQHVRPGELTRHREMRRLELQERAAEKRAQLQAQIQELLR